MDRGCLVRSSDSATTRDRETDHVELRQPALHTQLATSLAESPLPPAKRIRLTGRLEAYVFSPYIRFDVDLLDRTTISPQCSTAILDAMNDRARVLDRVAPA